MSSDGRYHIQKREKGDWVDLKDWTDSAAIRQGDAVNRLRLTAQGPKMRFYINGELAADVQDAAFRSGNIAVIVETGAKGGTGVAFDNLKVRPLTTP